jgi:hypothetical protein
MAEERGNLNHKEIKEFIQNVGPRDKVPQLPVGASYRQAYDALVDGLEAQDYLLYSNFMSWYYPALVAEETGCSVQEILDEHRTKDIKYPVLTAPFGEPTVSFVSPVHMEVKQFIADHMLARGARIISREFARNPNSRDKKLWEACCDPNSWTHVCGGILPDIEPYNGRIRQNWYLISGLGHLLANITDHDFFVVTVEWDITTGKVIEADLEIR